MAEPDRPETPDSPELPPGLVAAVQQAWEQELAHGPQASLTRWKQLLELYGAAMLGAALAIVIPDSRESPPRQGRNRRH